MALNARVPGRMTRGQREARREAREATELVSPHPEGVLRGNKRAARILLDMRKVYRDPRGASETEGQRMLRKLFAEDPGKFTTQLVRLEEAHAKKVASYQMREAGKEEGRRKKGKGRDEGTGRAMSLIEELLQEYKDEG